MPDARPKAATKRPRSIVLDDDDWSKAEQRAAEEHTTVRDVLRSALRAYAERSTLASRAAAHLDPARVGREQLAVLLYNEGWNYRQIATLLGVVEARAEILAYWGRQRRRDRGEDPHLTPDEVLELLRSRGEDR